MSTLSGILVPLLNLVVIVFIVRALISWLRIGYDSPFRPVVDGLYRVTEPILAPIRRVLPSFGGLDLSVLVVIFGIRLLLIPIAASLG
jgi:YggT family protein